MPIISYLLSATVAYIIVGRYRSRYGKLYCNVIVINYC